MSIQKTRELWPDDEPVDQRTAKLAAQRVDNLQRKYGVTVAQYDAMFSSQQGKCAICKEGCSTGTRLAVDHDHKTGRFRGLLCRSCNRGIGHFNDDPMLLRRTAAYVQLAEGSGVIETTDLETNHG